MTRILLFLILIFSVSAAGAQKREKSAPGLTTTPAAEMDRSAVQKELDAITLGYFRRTDLVQIMANGTLLKFYPRKQVKCGSIRTDVYDCLNNEWPDLKNFRKSFFKEGGKPKRKSFTLTEVLETERRHFDMVERLNTLLVGVRYESTLKPEKRYQKRLVEMRVRLKQLDKADAESAKMTTYILYGLGGLLILILVGGATFVGIRFSQKAAAEKAARRAAERSQVDDY